MKTITTITVELDIEHPDDIEPERLRDAVKAQMEHGTASEAFDTTLFNICNEDPDGDTDGRYAEPAANRVSAPATP